MSNTEMGVFLQVNVFRQLRISSNSTPRSYTQMYINQSIITCTIVIIITDTPLRLNCLSLEQVGGPGS